MDNQPTTSTTPEGEVVHTLTPPLMPPTPSGPAAPTSEPQQQHVAEEAVVPATDAVATTVEAEPTATISSPPLEATATSPVATMAVQHSFSEILEGSGVEEAPAPVSSPSVDVVDVPAAQPPVVVSSPTSATTPTTDVVQQTGKDEQRVGVVSGDAAHSTTVDILKGTTANERQELYSKTKLDNACLVAYVVAYSFLVERNEKPFLDTYWYTSDGGDATPGRHNNRKSTGGLTPSNAAHLRREGIAPVQFPEATTGIRAANAMSGVGREQSELLAPWMQHPTFLERIRPEPRFHRRLSSQDREMHHVLYHTHLSRSGSTPLAFIGLGMISNGLRSYGSIFGKGGHSVGGNESPSVGHVWITMPILRSMKVEMRTLVECSRNKKGPLYAAIEALRESMLTTKTSIKASIEVSIIDYNRLVKLESKAAGKLYLQNPKYVSKEEARSAPIDCETDSFVLISCMSGSHVQKKTAQEAAAFAVFRLTIEILLEGMVAGALVKPLALPPNATLLQRSLADDLQFDQRNIYFNAVANSEKNYEAAERMWRSGPGKKKVVAAAEVHRKSLRALASTIAPPVGAKRERGDAADDFFAKQMQAQKNNGARTVVAEAVGGGAMPTYDPQYAAAHQHHQQPHSYNSHSSASALPYDPRDVSQSPYPNPPQTSYGGGPPPHHQYFAVGASSSTVGWGEDSHNPQRGGGGYNNPPPPSHHDGPPHQQRHDQYQHYPPQHHQQPSASLGRRVEQGPPVPQTMLLGGAGQLPMVQYNPSMSMAPPQSPPPHQQAPTPPQPSAIELGNNCDFKLPENGFVSPRQRLNAFDQIAGLNTSQRSALVVNLHARMKTAISLWPKSAEELRSVDTFHLLRTIVDALGGYGKLEFEVVTEQDAEEEGGFFLPSFSGAVSALAPLVTKFRATISVILIAPENVFAYGPSQHALLMEMLRQGQGVDKSRVQEPMSQLVSGSGTEAVENMGTATKLASVAMIDAISPVIAAMHAYFRKYSAQLGI